MTPNDYLMEDNEEAIRLDRKTDPSVVGRQARWAGIKPGMRLADLGCGSGKTSFVLHELVQPEGEVVGFDFAPNRIAYAKGHYERPGLRFECCDVRDPQDEPGSYDFVWVRFLLEYYLAEAYEMVEHFSKLLKPGGILCLIDLDHNCLNHYGIPERLEKTLLALAEVVSRKGNFDLWVGRKLYTFLYDLGFQDLVADVSAHHLIYGPLNEEDAFNWVKKVEVAPQKLKFDFKDYDGSYEAFFQDFYAYLRNPRRFIYTPMVACRGIKP
jgi:ubiquinone/menaquinone biosynthesis C-methylase UbiE